MTAFPNYTQIPARLPVGAWQAIRVVTLLGAIGLAMALVLVPDDGLYVMWKVVIPMLPLLWLVVPGLWRNICPLSASNQTPRVLGLSKAKTAPPWLKEYGFVIGAGMTPFHITSRASSGTTTSAMARPIAPSSVTTRIACQVPTERRAGICV